MYAINTNITFTITIGVHATPPANLDLITVDPAGVTIFDEAGATNSAVYVAPTASVEGSYTVTLSFADPGRWSILLADGVVGNYTTVFDRNLNIEASETTYTNTFNLPA